MINICRECDITSGGLRSSYNTPTREYWSEIDLCPDCYRKKFKMNNITISRNEYFELRMAAKKLHLLEVGGVDNWGGYSESLYRNGNDLDKIEENLRREIFEDKKDQWDGQDLQ